MKNTYFLLLAGVLAFSATAAVTQSSKGANSPNIISTGDVVINGNSVSSSGEEVIIMTDNISVVRDNNDLTVKVFYADSVSIDIDCDYSLRVVNNKLLISCKD